MSRHLIIHPFKPIGEEATTGFEAEMHSLKQWLFWQGIDHAELWEHNTALPNLERYDAIWLSCFILPSKFGDLDANLRNWFSQLADYADEKPVYFIANDPVAWALPAELYELTMAKHFSIAFAGTNSWQDACNKLSIERVPLLSCLPEYANWVHLPIWQAQHLLYLPATYSHNQFLLEQSRQFSYIGYPRQQYRLSRLAELLVYQSVVQDSIVHLIGPSFNTDVGSLFAYGKMAYKEALFQSAGTTTVLIGDEDYACIGSAPHRLLQAWANDQLCYIDANLWPKADFVAEHGNWIADMFVHTGKELHEKHCQLADEDIVALKARQYASLNAQAKYLLPKFSLQ